MLFLFSGFQTQVRRPLLYARKYNTLLDFTTELSFAK